MNKKCGNSKRRREFTVNFDNNELQQAFQQQDGKYVVCEVDEDELRIVDTFDNRQDAMDFKEYIIGAQIAAMKRNFIKDGKPYTDDYEQYLYWEFGRRYIVAFDDEDESLDHLPSVSGGIWAPPGPPWLTARANWQLRNN